MILIWSNTGEWGGVDVIIMRFATHLVERGIDFVIVEPEDGRLRKDLSFARFVKVEEAAGMAGVITRIFMPSAAKLRDPLFPWNSYKDIPVFTWIVQSNDPVTTFVPWAYRLLHRFGYGSIRPLLRVLKWHTSLVSNLFQALANGGSLALMDEGTRRHFEFFYPSVRSDRTILVPIPSPLSDRVEKPASLDTPLAIGYLGRIDSFKWSALGPFIAENLAEVAQTRPVKLVAICEGEGVFLLAETCLRAGVELEVHGFMPNLEARRLLAERTCVAATMGTSALDLSGAGIPTLVLDPAVLPARAPAMKLFRFLHEECGYVLGEFRDFPGFCQKGRPLGDALALAQETDLSGIAREYVARNHDPDRCFDLLHSAIITSQTKAGEIAPIILEIEASFRAKQRLYRPALWFGGGRSGPASRTRT